MTRLNYVFTRGLSRKFPFNFDVLVVADVISETYKWHQGITLASIPCFLTSKVERL